MMTLATRCRRVLTGMVAAAGLLALLPAPADALTLKNSSSATMRLYLYDNNDSSVIASCFDTELPANTQVSWSGYPGTCGLYAVAKLKAVGVRSLVSTGGTCWGEHIDNTGSATVTGNVDVCSVTVVSD